MQEPLLQNGPQLLREVDNGLFSYRVLRTSPDQLRVYSNVDFLDEKVLKAYQAENERELSALLLNETAGDAALVVITFTSPLSEEEAITLTENAHMNVLSYGIFGRVDSEVVSTYVFPASRTIENFAQDTRLMESVGMITYDGIMIITGLVDKAGLQTISAYSKIGLLDLTANRIRTELSDLEETVGLEQFAIPNPAWYVYTGELELAQ